MARSGSYPIRTCSATLGAIPEVCWRIAATTGRHVQSQLREIAVGGLINFCEIQCGRNIFFVLNYGQCLEYYDKLKNYVKPENQIPETIIWIGWGTKMSHDWFRFLIDGYLFAESEHILNQLRNDTYRLLCNRAVVFNAA